MVALVGTHLNDPICTQEFLDAQYANMEVSYPSPSS